MYRQQLSICPFPTLGVLLRPDLPWWLLLSCPVPPCTGGELFDYVYKLDHLSEAEAAYYMQQLASFLQHAHDKHITHRCVQQWQLHLVGYVRLSMRCGRAVQHY